MCNNMYFKYSKAELEHLKIKDKKLAKIIERLGPIEREVDGDLFSAVVHHIVAQQISSKALATIWQRLVDTLGVIDENTILKSSDKELNALGISQRKILYIKEFAGKVKSGEFNIKAIEKMDDEQAIAELIKLKGIGVWTAQMLLLFCLQRKNILSYDDLAIRRGMRMVYRHREITKKLFKKYEKRLSPYCSVASLYFWAVAGGALEDITDPAPKIKKNNAK